MGSLNESMRQTTPNDLLRLSMPIPLNEAVYNNLIVNPIGPAREHAMIEDMVQCICTKPFSAHVSANSLQGLSF